MWVFPLALEGSLWIPCVAVPLARMTGRLARIKPRAALASANAGEAGGLYLSRERER
jgi:hypothetical protein